MYCLVHLLAILSALSGLVGVHFAWAAFTGSSSLDWLSFKSAYGKVYSSRYEDSMRRAIFARSKDYVDRFNAAQRPAVLAAGGYTLGLNHLSDLTELEMAQRTNDLQFLSPNECGDKKNNSSQLDYGSQFLQRTLNRRKFVRLPDEIDWRRPGNRVTPVTDQGYCGSSWAFAAIGALEGQTAVRKFNGSSGRLTRLSEQSLIDCTPDSGGCTGGSIQEALVRVRDAGGVQDASSYPYQGIEARCRSRPESAVFSDTGFVRLDVGDEETLKEVVAKFGPVAAGIDASQVSLRHYESGVYYEPRCCRPAPRAGGSSLGQPNHGVLIVGYGTDPVAGDFWLVKNSWGVNWGEKGYVRLARNRDNHCCIASLSVIPTF